MRSPDITRVAASFAIWICDVNGVLIDATALARDAFAATAARFRIPLQQDGLRRVSGRLLSDAYRLLDPAGDPIASSRFHLGYLRERVAEVRAHDDVAETLAAARAAGVRIAAVTSYGEIAEAYLVHTGLYHFLDVLVTQEEVRRPKPHPDALIRALDLLGCHGESRRGGAVSVGDTAIDVRAGRAAGVRTVAMTGGASHEVELRAAQPDDVMHRFGAMRRFVPEGRRRTDHATDLPGDRVLPSMGQPTRIASRANTMPVHAREP